MASSKPFFVEGMTVDQILNLDYQTLNKLDSRELSRALRTASLAANKRLTRLRKQAVFDKEKGYLPKGGAGAIAPYALNEVTQYGRKKFKWGVKKTKGNRNKMLQQLKEIRNFWNMTTSTTKGAAEVRRKSEERLFGKTREQAAKGKKGKKREAIYAAYEDRMKKAYEAYRKFLEYQKVNKWSSYEGSATLLELIGNIIEGDGSIDDALEAAIKEDERLYQQRQDEFNNAINGKDYFSL
jgi:hypothetical protein